MGCPSCRAAALAPPAGRARVASRLEAEQGPGHVGVMRVRRAAPRRSLPCGARSRHFTTRGGWLGKTAPPQQGPGHVGAAATGPGTRWVMGWGLRVDPAVSELELGDVLVVRAAVHGDVVDAVSASLCKRVLVM